MQDESLHEIQLNGKQLVFLFMAATVVAVVIFLCGVMVGRGVPQRAGVASVLPEQAVVDPTAAVQQLSPPSAVAGSGNAPLTAGETLTYPNRLADAAPAAETLRPLAETAALTEPTPAPKPATPVKPRSVAANTAPASKPSASSRAASAPKPAASRAAATAPKPAASAPKPASATANPAAPASAPPKPAAVPSVAPAPTAAAVSRAAEPPGRGFVVQVAAVRKREEAETIARRLSAKGYPAFVTTAGLNFRVRVGKYDDRREAEAVAGRLAREERVSKPWITQ